MALSKKGQETVEEGEVIAEAERQKKEEEVEAAKKAAAAKKRKAAAAKPKVKWLMLTSPHTLTHPKTNQRLTPNEPFKHEYDAWLQQMNTLGFIEEVDMG